MVQSHYKIYWSFSKSMSAILPAQRNVLNVDLTVKGKLLNDIYNVSHLLGKEKRKKTLCNLEMYKAQQKIQTITH